MSLTAEIFFSIPLFFEKISISRQFLKRFQHQAQPYRNERTRK
jgi:hypothetical protein